MSVRILVILAVFGLFVFAGADEPQTLVSWTFGGEEGREWTRRANHCREVRVEGGVLKGVTAGPDPFITSPPFSIPASAGDAVEFRAKAPSEGKGELFWTPVGAGGTQQKWSVAFDWIGDGEWHDYRIRPYWQGERRIAIVRLDFANGGQGGLPFEIAWVRIVREGGVTSAARVWEGEGLAAWRMLDGAQPQLRDGHLIVKGSDGRVGGAASPVLAIPAGEAFVVTIEMQALGGDAGWLEWASDAVSGLHRRSFRAKTDGLMHTYNLDMFEEKSWTGRIVQLRVTQPTGTEARIRAVRVSDEPQGPADVCVEGACVTEALPRAGRVFSLQFRFGNTGGHDASDVLLKMRRLPEGVRVVSSGGWNRVPTVPACGSVTTTVALEADRATSGEAEFAVTGGGTDVRVVRVPLEILPDLRLPRAKYVPEPKPVKSDYEIGAFYFPGWSKIDAWARIWPVAPERKPLLGWYDEANPEVVDWQIKWAVENGLSFFLVDWYWHKGYQHHDHWIKAFRQARYKSYLKWAIMWANHNPDGSHSESDQREVAKFWIENYFNTPEYYQIDGKPVVMIWSPQNMNRDLGPGGCERLLALSRQMAVEAGYKGIWFIAMKWPEGSWEPEIVRDLKGMGFDMTSIYHYMESGGRAENPRRFPFDLVADSNAAHWRGLYETGILPFLPNLSTGWDDRPWHGDKGREIYGRTVSHFRRICRDAKAFADETGVKRLTLAPLNEWGEGSYAEPCAEFGFGMYEAVRETFCQKPEAGWSPNYGPRDVGLGPYDLPPPAEDSTTDWTFRDGAQGWVAMMGIEDFKADGRLTFTSRTHDPALERALTTIRAKSFGQVVVRMRVPAATAGNCQLFWSSGGTPTEATSQTLPLAEDGQPHDYVFNVGKSKTWRGRVGRLRFDPCSSAGVRVEIERIRLIPVEE